MDPDHQVSHLKLSESWPIDHTTFEYIKLVSKMVKHFDFLILIIGHQDVSCINMILKYFTYFNQYSSTFYLSWLIYYAIQYD